MRTLSSLPSKWSQGNLQRGRKCIVYAPCSFLHKNGFLNGKHLYPLSKNHVYFREGQKRVILGQKYRGPGKGVPVKQSNSQAEISRNHVQAFSWVCVGKFAELWSSFNFIYGRHDKLPSLLFAQKRTILNILFLPKNIVGVRVESDQVWLRKNSTKFKSKFVHKGRTHP